jgi:hypothetical protein
MSGKAMKLIDPYSSLMECRACGTRHCASIKPDSNGRFYRGSWMCSNDSCPTNEKLWEEKKNRFVRVGFSPEMAIAS